MDNIGIYPEQKPEKSSKWTLVFLGILAVGAIYWVAVRPSSIRKQCSHDALESAVVSTNAPGYYEPDMLKREQLQSKLKNDFYISCIREKGLRQ